ncbi:MAG: hypothetical protein ACYCQJ_13380 [Nitrososphaerales archaeon]
MIFALEMRLPDGTNLVYHGPLDSDPARYEVHINRVIAYMTIKDLTAFLLFHDVPREELSSYLPA